MSAELSNVKSQFGTRLLLCLMAALIAMGIWAALHRTVRIDSAGLAPDWPDMRVNINTAVAAELNALPGIGPTLSQRIVDDRDQRGRFASLDDLKRVQGIGPAILERIRPFLVVE